MGIFTPEPSAFQRIGNMDHRISMLESRNRVSIECLKESLNIVHDMNRQLSDELRALYEYLGIERKELSGITFVKKGKD